MRFFSEAPKVDLEVDEMMNEALNEEADIPSKTCWFGLIRAVKPRYVL